MSVFVLNDIRVACLGMDLSLVRAGAASCELAEERQAGTESCDDPCHGSFVQSYLIYGLGWALSFRGFRGFRGKSSGGDSRWILLVYSYSSKRVVEQSSRLSRKSSLTGTNCLKIYSYIATLRLPLSISISISTSVSVSLSQRYASNPSSSKLQAMPNKGPRMRAVLPNSKGQIS